MSKIIGPFIRRYSGEYRFRNAVNAICTSFLSVAIGTYHLVFAVIGTRMVWSYALAAYYFTLALARISVLVSWNRGLRKGESELEGEIRSMKNYLGGGGLLVMLTMAFSVMILLETVYSYHFEYYGITIYAVALYVFIKIVFAAVSSVRYRVRYDDYTVQTFRNYNVADALTSLVTLQAALLARFGAVDETFRFAMNAVTGGIAAALVLALGGYMIIRGNKLLRRDMDEEKIVLARRAKMGVAAPTGENAAAEEAAAEEGKEVTPEESVEAGGDGE